MSFAINQEHQAQFATLNKPLSPYYYQAPNAELAANGMFGEYGGRFVPENLVPVMEEISKAFYRYCNDHEFNRELRDLHLHYSGRPTPVYHAANLSRQLGGAQIYLKREDLNHLGAHKLNNVLGQLLLAKRMGKTRVIAETGAGQHGVATAAGAALMGMSCTIYMGVEDMRRQELNVIRMRMMGTQVEGVTRGQGTLKEAVDQALEALIDDPDTFYLIGSAVGPHPYPVMVRHFQSVIGVEAREQILKMTDRLPDLAVACVGGGSNAIGLFAGFIDDPQVRLMGVEPGGIGDEQGQHAATISFGKPGVLHGFHSYLLQDEQGEAAPVYSISAGLDYPGVGPEHSYLKDIGRAEYTKVYDSEALDAFFALSRAEGIIPALESAHALAQAMKCAMAMRPEQSILVNLSGRGDKDVDQVAEMLKKGKQA